MKDLGFYVQYEDGSYSTKFDRLSDARKDASQKSEGKLKIYHGSLDTKELSLVPRLGGYDN